MVGKLSRAGGGCQSHAGKRQDMCEASGALEELRCSNYSTKPPAARARQNGSWKKGGRGMKQSVLKKGVRHGAGVSISRVLIQQPGPVGGLLTHLILQPTLSSILKALEIYICTTERRLWFS